MLNLIFFKERRHFWGLKIVKVAFDGVVAGVPIAANILLSLASHNNLTASAVATDTAVADVYCCRWLPWASAVIMVSAVAGVPLLLLLFLLLLTSQKLPLWLKSLLLPPWLLLLKNFLYFLLLLFPTFLASLLLLASLLWNIPSDNVVSTVLVSLLLASPDVAVVSCMYCCQPPLFI